MITWKGFLLIILISYVIASTSDSQPTRGKRVFAMIFGLYAMLIASGFFLILDSGLPIVFK